MGFFLHKQACTKIYMEPHENPDCRSNPENRDMMR